MSKIETESINKDFKKINKLKDASSFKTRLHNVNFGWMAFALGIMTLGNTWFQYLGVMNPGDSTAANVVIPFQAVCSAIQLAIIVLIITKMAVNFKDVINASREPTETAHLPLIFLLLISFSSFLFQLSGFPVVHNGMFIVGQIFWWLGMIPFFLYFWYFWFIMFKKAKIKDIDSSLLIPNVGFSVGTAVPANMFDIPFYSVLLPILWIVAAILYVICLVLILWRHLFVEPALSRDLAPSIAIIGSGGSLLLATYYGIGVDAHSAGVDQFYDDIFTPDLTIFITWAFFIVSISVGFIVYLSMFKYLLARKFNPNLNSYSFPTAIAAAGSLTFATFASDNQYSSALVNGLEIAGLVQLIISSMIHLYLLIGNTYSTSYVLCVSPSNYNFENKLNHFYNSFLED